MSEQAAMSGHGFLVYALIYLGAAVIAVPVFKRFGLASVLGYLAAGSIIGPAGIGFIDNVETIMGFAEFGVVLLLFIIGLELQPSRLWELRKSIFVTGGSQVVITALPIGLVAYYFDLGLTASIVVAISLAFSSTAFVLQILDEKGLLSTRFGRSAFSILLFQDIAAIPLIAIVPLLGVTSPDEDPLWLAAVKALGVIALLLVAGRYLMRPALRLVASARTSELFTTAALFLVVAVSYLMEVAGLSMALGAFVAGVMLADSEYRHELEADIQPFKGLLLGLFFMTIGMTVSYGLLIDMPGVIAALTLGLIALKLVVFYGLGNATGLDRSSARHLTVFMSQGGEFAFVVFTAAVAERVISTEVSGLLILVVTLSMVITPVMVLFNERVLESKFARRKPAFDAIEGEENEVIIAGFGRVGQIAGRTLRVLGVNFTALEHDPDQVEVLRKFGNKVYYGDASKIDLLRAAGAEKARIFVLAIDDVEASLKSAAIVKQHFPHLTIFARARNRTHAYELMDLGIKNIWRETLGSSIEMTEGVLATLGYSGPHIRKTMERFREHDDQVLREQHKVWRDEGQVINLSKLGSQQLSAVLKSDRRDQELTDSYD